ncbi:hypothetical protein Tdes44962_MAKER09605 [Teratosphaeria destructans]|uniref:Uncharacterized protein n=1 Tax=Teratosphaeria destructans TaxID=418781 RepID=A0A9W7SSR8_9PEZI|nr:hypothetical protein Tdes44962_MAKER09605 [Teratosphaeria destructans]
MGAMGVLYQEYVEEPQRFDKNFTPRKPSPIKWQILRKTFTDNRKRLERQYYNSEKDARMACTALQTVLDLWQQGLLPEH